MDFSIREIQEQDLQAIVEIDAIRSGEAKPDFWRKRLQPLFRDDPETPLTLGFVAVTGGRVIGHILAEGRAWEFGSPLCGWIFAIGVHPEYARRGVGLALCREVCRAFKKRGIRTIRTMVRKDDVDVLSFFRASGFHAGPFIELELEMEE